MNNLYIILNILIVIFETYQELDQEQPLTKTAKKTKQLLLSKR